MLGEKVVQDSSCYLEGYYPFHNIIQELTIDLNRQMEALDGATETIIEKLSAFYEHYFSQ